MTPTATAYKGWGKWSVDVRTALLTAELDDEDVVLVKPPRIFAEARAIPEGTLVGKESALWFKTSADVLATT